MARKDKIDNAILKKFARQEGKRKVDIRNPKVYFLIVCEGTKTEPNYFRAIKKELPAHTLEIEILGTGANTLSLVEQAIQHKTKSNRKFDSVWLVFDRDSFPDDHFDNAIHKAEANNIKCAWSNEAFELWYLLHFMYINTNTSRGDYAKLLEQQFAKQGLAGFQYHKNAENLYSLLQQYGSEINAIHHAIKLRATYNTQKYSTHNPCTSVDLLIAELRNPQQLLNI